MSSVRTTGLIDRFVYSRWGVHSETNEQSLLTNRMERHTNDQVQIPLSQIVNVDEIIDTTHGSHGEVRINVSDDGLGGREGGIVLKSNQRSR